MSDSKNIGVIIFSIIGSILLVIIKVASGIIGNSYALVADGIESANDVISSIFAFVGLKYSMKPPDKEHPYGHGRIEPLITFVILLFMLFSAGVIINQSIENINTPHALPAQFTLYVIAGVILIKEFMFRWEHKKALESNNSTLKADAMHHRADALTSAAAFIGVIIARYLGPGYEAADDWAALLAAIVIIYNTYFIFKPAFAEMMDEQNHDDLIQQIRIIASDVNGVEETEKCFVRKVGNVFIVDLHIIVDPNMTVLHSHELGHEVERKLVNSGLDIKFVNIHVEPFGQEHRNLIS